MAYEIAENITWKNLEKGIVLLDLESSAYFTLNETASDIWSCITKEMDRDQIIAHIISEYDVPREVCEADVDEQIKFFFDEKILVG